jgi:hypothetical protein
MVGLSQFHITVHHQNSCPAAEAKACHLNGLITPNYARVVRQQLHRYAGFWVITEAFTNILVPCGVPYPCGYRYRRFGVPLVS